MSDRYSELMRLGVAFNLMSINKFSEENDKDLELMAMTTSVKIAQMLRYQKVILAVGMFSIFESSLQRRFKGDKNAFSTLKIHLKSSGEIELNNRFELFAMAINTLKHGKGPSYNNLLKKK